MASIFLYHCTSSSSMSAPIILFFKKEKKSKLPGYITWTCASWSGVTKDRALPPAFPQLFHWRWDAQWQSHSVTASNPPSNRPDHCTSDQRTQAPGAREMEQTKIAHRPERVFIMPRNIGAANRALQAAMLFPPTHRRAVLRLERTPGTNR